MKSACLTIILFSAVIHTSVSAGVSDESDGSVRFDAQRTLAGYQLVARGKPGMAEAAMDRAFAARAQSLCPDAKTPQPPKRSEYPYADGGTSFLMPAGGVLLPMTAPMKVKPAPALAGMIECGNQAAASANAQPANRLRLSISSKLGTTIPYVDQGFASFNRQRLEVPTSGPSFDDIAANAFAAALRERGYGVEIVAPGDAAAADIVISRASNPGESFDGVVMMTKIGLLGIDKASYAFCSLRIGVRAQNASTVQVLGQINTRDRIDAIYSDWKSDMSNGPSGAVNAKVYATLSSTLESDVKAVVHAIPAKTIELLASGGAGAGSGGATAAR